MLRRGAPDAKETVYLTRRPASSRRGSTHSSAMKPLQCWKQASRRAADIDKAVKLGLNHPMGPFEMVDLVGLDVRLKILEYLHATLGREVSAQCATEEICERRTDRAKSGEGYTSTRRADASCREASVTDRSPGVL